MKFQFRFETLLRLRSRQRDEAGAEVGQAREAIRRVDQQRDELNRQRVELRRKPTQDRTGEISVDRLLSAGRYDMQLEAEDQALLQTRGELIKELARRQQKFSECESELRRFEKLKEQDRQRHVAEIRKLEQAESDEAVSQRFALAIQRRERT